MAKKQKLSAKELMDSVVDLDLLKKRKEDNDEKKKQKNENIEIKKEIKKEKKWFELPMKKENFSIIEKDNKFYSHYSEWKENIYIGPYDTEKELNQVIDMYVKETKKTDLLKRNFNVEKIHTIIL